MAPSIVVAIITSVPPFVAAVIAAIAGRKAYHKALEIHVLVNSAREELTRELVVANERIAEMQKRLDDRRYTSRRASETH